MSRPSDDPPPGDAFRERIGQFQRTALLVGVMGLATSLASAFLWPQPFFSSYLIAFLFWVGIGLGCVGLTMLHHLVGGQWGLPIRRPLEAGAMTLIPLAAFFVPLAFNLERLYPWARADEVRLDPELSHKSAYLNPSFFLIRAACYFAVWVVLAVLVSRLSRNQDTTSDPSPSLLLQRLSAPGLVLLFLTSSFAAIDWGMSLEPKWASTIYGAMMITGEALSTLAIMVVVAAALASEPPLDQAVSPSRLHDLGNLMLAFVMLWAYMSFSQFLIIWSGNLSEETPWYLRRTQGGWQWVALALIVVHFFLPFFVLLLRESKRRPDLLVRVAWVILVMHLVDLTWLVMPATGDAEVPRIPWASLPLILVAMAGIGGVLVAAFLRQLSRSALVPLHDPHLEAALQRAGGH